MSTLYYNFIRINGEISKAILKMNQDEENIIPKENEGFSFNHKFISNQVENQNLGKYYSNKINDISISSTESNSSIQSNKSFSNIPYNYNSQVINFPYYNNLFFEKNKISPLFSYNKPLNFFPFKYPYKKNYSNGNINNQTMSLNNNQYDNNNKFDPKRKNNNLDIPRNKIHLESILRQKDKRTTIMIRHIPNKYSIKLLVDELNVNFKDKFDLIYLPIDNINCCNLGFGFINFTHIFHILDFYDHYNGKKWKKFNSEKKCELAYSKIQGKDDLLKNLMLSENYNNIKNIPIHYLNENVKETPLLIPLKYFQAFLNFYPYASYNIINNQLFVINSLYNF